MKEQSPFAEKLARGLNVIENLVVSPLSNGFIKGTNSKLKIVKRIIFGCCNKDVLATKLMYRG